MEKNSRKYIHKASKHHIHIFTKPQPENKERKIKKSSNARDDEEVKLEMRAVKTEGDEMMG